jgi:RNA polymerase sigma-70 factor (ECF subfamily)
MGADDFATFFRREFPRLVLHLATCGFARQAEDAAEEAMHEAFKKWHTINEPDRWVRTVALRYAQRDALREGRRNVRDGAYVQQLVPSAMLGPEQKVEITEEQSSVLKRIEYMPFVRRWVVALAFDGYTVREIAAELGVVEATVRSHLRHARRTLGETTGQTGGAA